MRVAAFAAKTAFGLGLLLLASWNLPLAVADCPGGCGSGQPSSSCCVVTAPDGTQQCFGGCSGSTPKACCPGGFTAGCGAADSCCTSAECTGGQICQVTDKPYATCSCPAGKTLCGGQCTNTRLDFNNCGGCGNVCPASTDKCCAGQCVSCPIRGECVGDEPKRLPARPTVDLRLGGYQPSGLLQPQDRGSGDGLLRHMRVYLPRRPGLLQRGVPKLAGRPGQLRPVRPALYHRPWRQSRVLPWQLRGPEPRRRQLRPLPSGLRASAALHQRRVQGGPPGQGGRCDPSCTCPLPGETCVRGLCSLPQ
jgi:hypothetical protein